MRINSILLLFTLAGMVSCGSNLKEIKTTHLGRSERFIEKIYVPSATQNPTTSGVSLDPSKKYRIEVSGTYGAGDTIVSDADYSITKKVGGDFWTDRVTNYEKHGERLLNLLVQGHGNKGSIEWGAFNKSHTYSAIISGEGTHLQFVIYDIYDENNSGGLTIKVFELQ